MTADVLAFQVRVPEWEISATPVPVKAIDAGELDALLTTETLPVALPVAAGAKVTSKVTICPEVTISPADTPLAVKPGPEIVTFEIVILELPELVNVTPRLLLLLMSTFPKLRADALATSRPGGTALTVRIAALLVALPAVLLITTVNCAPLDEVVSAGVV